MIQSPKAGWFIIKCLLILIFALQGSRINAQLCTGSLGDPVVNITFGNGSGGNTGYAPTGAYTYTSSTCPNDGYYTITGSTSGCFDNHWHTINSDHTGGGAFMLINASYEPGDFFVTTVSNLCPNTTYQFSAWIINVLNTFGIRPNLTFKIEANDGSVLGEYSTGDILQTSEPTWKEYGLYFTTPSDNAEITLRITNNAPGGNGNDLGLDDITFRPCGPDIKAMIRGNANTVDICDGNTTTYTFVGEVSAEFTDPVYQWQISVDKGISWKDIPGATGLSYTRQPTGKGFYWYRMAVVERVSESLVACRVASNTVEVNVHGYPEVNAGPDRISIAATPVTLQGSATGEQLSYYWNPSLDLDNDTILTPIASPTSDITYTLYAASVYGCSASDAVFVKAVAGIFVPNAFTPNNDGVNDHWRIPYLDPLLDATVQVYNRFGQMIYHVEGATVDWDGTYKGIAQATGVYVYTIRFKSVYPDMKGTVLLIR